MTFQGPDRLRSADGTHGPCRHSVGVHRENIHFAVVDLVGTVNPAGGPLCDSRTVIGVSTGVHQHFSFTGDQSPVTFNASSDPACRRVAADGEHGFGSTLRHAHGPTDGFSRHRHDHRFNLEVGFPTEGAPDVGNDHFDFGV